MRFSLLQKTSLTLGVCIVLILSLTAYFMVRLSSLSALQDAGAARAEDAIRVQEAALMGDKIYHTIAGAVINRNLDKASVEWTNVKREALDDMKAVQAAAGTAEERRLCEQAEAGVNELIRGYENDLLPILRANGDWEQIRAVDEKLDRAKDSVQAAMDKLRDSLSSENREADKAYDTVQGEVWYVGWIVAALSAACACAAAWWLVATVRPVHAVVERLGGSADLVSSASGQVSQASQALAEGASEQASSLEETSASLEEMAAMTKQNADNARQASAMANESRASAGKGHDAMVRMVEAIGRIKTSSDQTAKILKTIDEIAFQTNLLALNAAVEAARAGDAGRGFAVVAEEVRNLAQRCAEAARTTSALIEDAQTNSDNGVSVSGEVAGILKQIVASTDKATHLISEVSAATEEQSRGIEQVNTAVAQMDKVTQSNAANAEESASASEELSAQARELRGLADVLATVVSGTPNQVRPLASPAPLPSHTLAAQGQHVASSRVQGLLAHAGGGGNSKRAPAARNRVADRAANNPPSPAETIPLDDEELKRF